MRPAHVAAVAQVFGLATPDVTTARVLEIGCGGGGNLIPVAAMFPGARCLGIDLSPLQIGQARERATAAGLGNIEFRTASVTDIDADWGTFDYIVCHGVYSWVPAEVQRAILRIAGERLADKGAAVISYNVLPGWHLRKVARDAMLAHAGQFDAPDEKLAQGRAFLDFLKDHAPQASPYGQVLQREASMLAAQSDDYVLHEFLETENNPCTVTEFVAAAEAAGLGYLADSEIHGMLPENHGAALAAQLREIATTPLKLEQYVDIAIGRTFRQSILMKPAALARMQRSPTSASMTGLHVAATFVEAPQTFESGPFVFKARTRRSDDAFRTLTTPSPMVARILAALDRRWPGTATATELMEAAVSTDAPREEVAAAVLDTLFRLMATGMLQMSTAPSRAARADSTHPLAWSLARADVARGDRTTSLHHEAVRLDGPSHTLLPLLDGTRDRPALVAALLEMVNTGAIELQHDGAPVIEPEARVQAVTVLVDSAIQALASAALLSA